MSESGAGEFLSTNNDLIPLENSVGFMSCKCELVTIFTNEDRRATCNFLQSRIVVSPWKNKLSQTKESKETRQEYGEEEAVFMMKGGKMMQNMVDFQASDRSFA